MVQTFVRVVFAVVFATAGLGAQQKPVEDPSLRDLLLEQWNEIGDKVIKMAEEFPEDKYEFRPAKEVRTFADVLRHVAFWNDWVARTARGEKPDGKPNELPKVQFATKAQIVDALKRNTAAAASQLKSGAAPAGKAAGLWTAFIGHSSEHYGQLVVYYRLNGLVPPASRGQ